MVESIIVKYDRESQSLNFKGELTFDLYWCKTTLDKVEFVSAAKIPTGFVLVDGVGDPQAGVPGDYISIRFYNNGNGCFSKEYGDTFNNMHSKVADGRVYKDNIRIVLDKTASRKKK